MAAHKKIDRICCAVLILSLILTILFMNGEALGLQASAATLGYETRLFDTTRVHTIDIVMDDWDTFIEGCEDEEYEPCAVVIDGESYKNVAIRAKGNTSLSSVRQLGSQRYSFKIEFDHYDSGKTYHGLDKLCLNNLIQDNTMMKDYLVYRLMGNFGVASPLCSYVYITVNGEDWGLYLAVEGVGDAFLERNYGKEAGELYKPDSMSFGGGRGNGRDFDMEDFEFDADGLEPPGAREFHTRRFSGQPAETSRCRTMRMVRRPRCRMQRQMKKLRRQQMRPGPMRRLLRRQAKPGAVLKCRAAALAAETGQTM